MKARIRVELPPGAVLTKQARAALVRSLNAQLDTCAGNCAHDLEKGEKRPRRLPHRAPQQQVDRSVELYEALMKRMVDEVVGVLSE